MMMRRLYTKDAGGAYKAQDISHTDLVEWFKSHSTEDGTVTEDAMLDVDVEIKASDDGPMFVMSDFSVDRDLERIDPEGWDLKSYKRNPLLLWSHDWSIPAIGRVEKPGKRDGQLVGRPVFDTKENDPFAAMIGEKVNKGYISTGSVGFVSRQIEIIDDPKEPAQLIHRKAELVEFSIVNIPSNINAEAMRSVEPEKVNTGHVVPHYSEELFKDNRETSGKPERETSDLDFMFSDSDAKVSIEELLHGSED